MARNQFGRYLWLLDTLRKHPKITFEQIAKLWEESTIGNGAPLSWRTFMDHKRRCEETFNIVIECDRHNGYLYSIANSDIGDYEDFQNWLIDSYSVLKQLQRDRHLAGRILFEDVPAGNLWLTTISEAISKSRVIEISHKGFEQKQLKRSEIEPYFLKFVKRRWYLIGRSIKYSEENRELNRQDGGNRDENVYRIYALDRILQVVITDKSFEMVEGFDIGQYFKGCLGVIPNDGTTEKVVVRAYDTGPSYLRSLPLHQSQQEIATNQDGSVDFCYEICPNNDFIQAILMQGPLVEVISPKRVRKKVKDALESIAKRYS